MRLLALLSPVLILLAACSDRAPRRVLVAKEDLRVGQRLQPTDLIVKLLGKAERAAWLEEDDLGLVSGRVLRVALPANSPLSLSVLDSGEAVMPLDERVPEGLIALSLWVRGGHWARAEDFVDVIISFLHVEGGERVSHLLLQDVPVLETGPTQSLTRDPAIAGPAARPERIEERRLTLLLHPAEAPLLLLAYGLGPVHVALRHPDDRSLADPGDQVTVERLLEQTRKPPTPSEIPGLVPSERLDPPGALR